MKCKTRIFWTILDANIQQTRAQCLTSNPIYLSQPKEHLISLPKPELPFHKTLTDFYKVEAALVISAKAKKICSRIGFAQMVHQKK